jgi:hypothetical protein
MALQADDEGVTVAALVAAEDETEDQETAPEA